MFVASTFTKVFGMQWSAKFYFVRGSPITSRIDMRSSKKGKFRAFYFRRLIFSKKGDLRKYFDRENYSNYGKLICLLAVQSGIIIVSRLSSSILAVSRLSCDLLCL